MKRKLTTLGIFLSLLTPVFLTVDVRPAHADSWDDIAKATPMKGPKKPKPDGGGDPPRPRPTPGPKDGGGEH